MIDLQDKHCVPCEGGMPSMPEDQVKNLLLQRLPEWQTNSLATEISREFKFKNYLQTIDFVNKVAGMAQLENHHPDMLVRYNTCKVTYSTHAIHGLSENDFICAAKVNHIFQT